MKLYGAKVSQQYLQLPRGKRKLLYPHSNEYPIANVGEIEGLADRGVKCCIKLEKK